MNYTALRTELLRDVYAGKSDAEAVVILMDATEATTRPKTLSAVDMIPLVSEAGFAAVFDHPTFIAFKDKVNSQDREAVLEWVAGYHARKLITDADRIALNDYVHGTETVMKRPADRIGWGEIGVTTDDVAAARKPPEQRIVQVQPEPEAP